MKKYFIFIVFIFLFGCGGENNPQLEKWKVKEAIVEKTSDPNVLKESVSESKKESIHSFENSGPKEHTTVPGKEQSQEKPWTKPELVAESNIEQEPTSDGGLVESLSPDATKPDVIVPEKSDPPENTKPDDIPQKPPRAFSLTPSTWPKGCDVELFVSGLEFHPSSKVLFGQTVFSAKDPVNKLRFINSGRFSQYLALPLSGSSLVAGKTYPVQVKNGPLTSKALSFSVTTTAKAPKILSVNPSKLIYGQQVKVEVGLSRSGSLVQKGAVIRVNGKKQQGKVTCVQRSGACFGDRFEVVLDLQGLQPGLHDLTIEGPCVGQSHASKITIVGPPSPELHELVPGFGKVGTKQNIRIKGKFLTQKTKLLWDNKEVQAKYISPTELEFAADFSNQQARTITVSLEDEFGNQSNLVRFSILDQQTSLTLASATPSSLKNGVLHKNIVVEGSGFTANTELFFGQTKLQVKFHSATKLEITELDLTQVLSGSHSLQAEDGGKKSNLLHLYVIPFPAPEIKSLTPITMKADTTKFVSIRADNVCEKSGFQCKRNPKVLVFDAQGVVVPGVFEFQRVSTFSISGKLSSVGLKVGNYSIRIQRASGELSNPLTLEILPPDTPLFVSMSKQRWYVGGRVEIMLEGRFFCTPTAQHNCSVPPIVHIVDKNKQDHVGAFVATRTGVYSRSYWQVLGFLDTSKLSVGQYSVYLEHPKHKLVSKELTLTLDAAKSPFISRLGTKNLEKGKKHVVDVIGNFFSVDLTVMMGQKALPTTYLGPDRLSIEIDATNLQAGSYKLHLEDKQQNKSEPYYFALNDPTAVGIYALDWLMEKTPYLGLTYRQLTIYGNDLTSQGTNVGFLFNGKPLFDKPTCRGVGSSSSCVLRNLNTKNAGLKVGENTISCQLNDGSKCPEFKFWVQKVQAPKVLSVSHFINTYTALHIQGEFFQPGLKVYIDGKAYIPRAVTTTLITFLLGGKDGLTLSSGKYELVVENPDGQKSNKMPFLIP